MYGQRDVVAEVCAGLEVAVVQHVSVQIGLRPDTLVRSSLDVAGVIHHTCVDFEGVAAFGFIGVDGVDGLICLVESDIGVVGILVLGALSHVSHLPVPEIEAGSPVEIVGDASLHVGEGAEHLAAHAIVVDAVLVAVKPGMKHCPLLVRPEVIVLQSRSSVEAPEVVHGIVDVCYGCIEAHAGHKIL